MVRRWPRWPIVQNRDMAPQKLSITWYGHSTFVITTPGGKRIVTDPWLETEPEVSAGHEEDHRGRFDPASRTGTADHTGDVVAVSRATGAPIVASYELALWFERKGLQNVHGMSIGGNDRASRASRSRWCRPSTPAASSRTTRPCISGACRLRRPHGGRSRRSIRRRHGGVRRHAADRGDACRRGLGFCQSAITSRWARRRRPRGANARRPPGGADALRNVPRPHRHARAAQEARRTPASTCWCLKPGRDGAVKGELAPCRQLRGPPLSMRTAMGLMRVPDGSAISLLHRFHQKLMHDTTTARVSYHGKHDQL